MKKVRAVILAGGKGHRLDKYQTPKPLVRVGGRTLLSRNIGILTTAGIRDITVLVSSDDTVITSFIMKKFDNENNIRVVRSSSNTASELDAMLDIDSSDDCNILITACDLVFETNPFHTLLKQGVEPNAITALVSTDKTPFEESGANVKILCTQRKILSVGPELEHFDSMLVGTYLFSPGALHDFQKRGRSGEKVRYPDNLFMHFAKEERLDACSIGAMEWYDVNTPTILLRAELLVQRMITNRMSLPFRRTNPKVVTYKPNTYFYNKKKLRTDILIEKGILNNLQKKDILPLEYKKSPHFIITDKKVDELYGKKLETDLKKLGWLIDKLVIAEGEGVKALETYTELTEELLERGIDKRSIIISLGGGVVNNIAGFLAATIYRGIGLIHIPTTLLAQNDAAIGIKQGVNGPMGKNLIGAKYSPLRIIIDSDVLKTLSERQIKDGLSECIKHALAQDKHFYSYLMKYDGSIRDLGFLETIVKKNIELKIKLMQGDFNEEHEALVLLYGHEVGHAVEYLSGFSYGHGEAIAIGMRVSIEIASLLGIASQDVVGAHKAIFQKYSIDTYIPKNISCDAIVDMLRFDKKFHGGDIYVALIANIGKLWKRGGEYLVPVSESIIIKAIENSYEE